jgi:hypothetical protein
MIEKYIILKGFFFIWKTASRLHASPILIRTLKKQEAKEKQ